MAFSSTFARALATPLAAALALTVTLALAATATPARAEKFPKVEKEAVLADQKQHDAEWRARIAASKSRVFFTDAEWPQVIAEVAKIPADNPFRIYVDEALKKVLAKPLPVYATPEEIVAQKRSPSLYSAMEELWQRSVGEDLITLSLVVKLNMADEPTLALCRTRMKELALAACTWPTWGRCNRPAPDNADLACGHLSLGLGYAYNLHGATLFTDSERETIRKALREKLVGSNGTLSGLYGGMYWATGYQDNHLQVAVAGLGVVGTVFYDEIPEAPEWLAAARLAHANIARFSQTDGSSDEGIPYWSYARWANVHYIDGTRPVTGADAMYHDDFLKNAISWRLYSSTCGFAGTLPWGDAPPRDYYGPHFLMLRVGAVCDDATGVWLTKRLPFRPQGGSDAPVLTAMFGRKYFTENGKDAPPAPPTGGSTAPAASAPAPTKSAPGDFVPGLDSHFPVNDSVTTRSGWGADDFLIAMKSGFTNRNHSHLDAGALALAIGSKWSLRTSGYGKGSSQKGYWDSGKLRWTYFSNATESQSALLVNGKNQRHDPKARGTVDQFLTSPSWTWASVDLTSAYYDVAAARRSLLHRRGDYALVLDTVSAAPGAAPIKVEWLAQVIADPVKQGDSATADATANSNENATNALHIPCGGEGKNREVVIRPLDAMLSFAPRQPTAEHVDMAKESIRTYALAAAGSVVRYAVLLQPLALLGSAGTGSSAPLIAKYETEEGGAVQRITIESPKTGEGSATASASASGWTDRILTADAPRAWKLDAAPGSPLTATAQTVAMRTVAQSQTKGKSPTFPDASIIAARVTELSLDGITYKGEPASIALQRISPDTWIIDADRDILSALTLPKGLSLYEFPQQSPAPGVGRRYVAGTSKDVATQAANAWLAR